MNYKIEKIEEGGLTYKVYIYPDGNKYWRYKDLYHRLNGPAIECADGYKAYYIKGIFFKTFEDYKEAAIQIKIKEILNGL